MAVTTRDILNVFKIEEGSIVVVRQVSSGGRAHLVLIAAVAVLWANTSCGVMEWVDEGAAAEQEGFAILGEDEVERVQRTALPLGGEAVIADYAIVVARARDVGADDPEILAGTFPDSRPPRGRFAIVDVHTIYRGQSSVIVDSNYDLELRYLATDNRAYVESWVCGPRAAGTYTPEPTPSPESRSHSFTVCFNAPADTIAGGYVGVRNEKNPFDANFTWWHGVPPVNVTSGQDPSPTTR